jgi:hypothetical protein
MDIDMRKVRRAYKTQRRQAAMRGIAWGFTFESWLAWWGDDLARRGPMADELCMQRIADRGPYSPENTIKGRPARNVLTVAHRKRHEAALLAVARLEQERDRCIAEPEDTQDDDEAELQSMLGIANSHDSYVGV